MEHVLKEWVAMEHYRLRCVVRWPDSSYKEVVLASIHSTLERLGHTCDGSEFRLDDLVAAGEKKPAAVREWPRGSRNDSDLAAWAA